VKCLAEWTLCTFSITDSCNSYLLNARHLERIIVKAGRLERITIKASLLERISINARHLERILIKARYLECILVKARDLERVQTPKTAQKEDHTLTQLVNEKL